MQVIEEMVGLSWCEVFSRMNSGGDGNHSRTNCSTALHVGGCVADDPELVGVDRLRGWPAGQARSAVPSPLSRSITRAVVDRKSVV